MLLPKVMKSYMSQNVSIEVISLWKLNSFFILLSNYLPLIAYKVHVSDINVHLQRIVCIRFTFSPFRKDDPITNMDKKAKVRLMSAEIWRMDLAQKRFALLIIDARGPHPYISHCSSYDMLRIKHHELWMEIPNHKINYCTINILHWKSISKTIYYVL